MRTSENEMPPTKIPFTTPPAKSATCEPWYTCTVHVYVCEYATAEERPRSHVNAGVAANAGDAVKRNKYKGAVSGDRGRLGPRAIYS